MLSKKVKNVEFALEDLRESVKASIYSKENPDGILTAECNKYLQHLQFYCSEFDKLCEKDTQLWTDNYADVKQ